MKKLSILVIIAFCLSFSKKSTAHRNEQPNCYDPFVENYVAATDSMSAFFSEIKGLLAGKDFDLFMAIMKQGKYQDALSLCGNKRQQLEDKLVTRFNKCVSDASKLYQAIDTKRTLTEQQRRTAVSTKTTCYIEGLADSYFMPYKSIAAKSGSDCGLEFSRCKRTAKKTYVSQLWDCFFDGVAVSVINGPLGLGVGLGCVATAWFSYDAEMMGCQATYNSCLRK